jgi:hypothetical protein
MYKGPNKIIVVDQNTVGLILEPSNKVCLIDKEDYDLVKNYRWYLFHKNLKTIKCSYVRAHHWINNKRGTILIHRLIMNPAFKLEIDHINGDGLSNKKINLRTVTRQQNQQNQHSRRGTSKYKGVHWHKMANAWESKININGVYTYLGIFVNEVDAAIAYNKAASKYFGEYANLNKI